MLKGCHNSCPCLPPTATFDQVWIRIGGPKDFRKLLDSIRNNVGAMSLLNHCSFHPLMKLNLLSLSIDVLQALLLSLQIWVFILVTCIGSAALLGTI